MITNLADALKIMIARYATLVTYYARLAETAKKDGKPVPKTGMLIYNAAVADYMRYGSDVWKEIVKRKLTVEMVKIGPDGKPQRDPKRPGHVLTKKIGVERMPLRPPVFVAPGIPYPSASAPYPAPKPTVAGDVIAGDLSGSDIGFGWKEIGEIAIVVVLGVAAATIIGMPIIALVVIGVGGAAIAVQEIALALRGPSANVAENLDAYTRIYQQGIKSGMTPTEAADAARKAMAESRKAPESGGIGIVGMVLGLAALGGGILLLSKKSPA